MRRPAADPKECPIGCRAASHVGPRAVGLTGERININFQHREPVLPRLRVSSPAASRSAIAWRGQGVSRSNGRSLATTCVAVRQEDLLPAKSSIAGQTQVVSHQPPASERHELCGRGGHGRSRDVRQMTDRATARSCASGSISTTPRAQGGPKNRSAHGLAASYWRCRQHGDASVEQISSGRVRGLCRFVAGDRIFAETGPSLLICCWMELFSASDLSLVLPASS